MPSWFAITVIIAVLYAAGVISDSIPALDIRQTSSDPNAILPGWTRVGCFRDQGGLRVLSKASFTSATMTPAACMSLCTPGNFAFAGVEFHNECFCDFAMQTNISAPDSACNDPCAGDSALICGGMSTITIFANGAPNVIHPTNKPFVNTWQYKGCFSELDPIEPSGFARDLQRMVGLSGPVTVETCTAACKASSFALAGLENGGECWCGHAMLGGVRVADSNCLIACTGDPTEFCGSSGSNNVNFQSCLQTKIVGDVILKPVLQNGSSIPNAQMLSEVSDATFPQGFSILSACNSGVCLDHTNLGLVGPGILNGQQAISFSVNPGDSPVTVGGVSGVTFFNGYCWMANPINPIGPLFQPLLLGANSRADLWALCPNITAGGRLDVVFSPADGHPNYRKTDCEAIFIETIIETQVAIVSV